ncbi:hypothetical protein ACNOYE_03020 [Nannocystaceae bacterium ST9]
MTYDRLSIGLLATLGACTLRPATLEGGDDEIGDTGDSDSTDSDSTDSDSTGGEPLAECITEQGTLVGSALLLDQGIDTARLFVEGGELPLELVGSDPGVYLQAAAMGEQVAIARSSGFWAKSQTTTIQAFDRSSGALAWSIELAGSWTNDIWAAEDGWVSGRSFNPKGLTPRGFATDGEQMIELADHSPLAAPREGLVVAVEAGDYGWYALADGSWTTVDPPASAGTSTMIADDDRTFEYVAEGEFGVEFVRASPNATQTFPLELAPELVVEPMLAAGDFRVLSVFDGVGESTSFVRVDVESGEVLPLAPRLPAGFEWFDPCFGPTLALTPEGRLIVALRDTAVVQLFDWTPETDEWNAIGLPIAGPARVTIDRSDAALIASATSFDSGSCAPLVWTEPPIDALPADSVQLVQPAPTPVLSLPANALDVSPEPGQPCVAYREGNADWTVRAAASDAALVLGPGDQWLWLD